MNNSSCYSFYDFVTSILLYLHHNKRQCFFAKSNLKLNPSYQQYLLAQYVQKFTPDQPLSPDMIFFSFCSDLKWIKFIIIYGNLFTKSTVVCSCTSQPDIINNNYAAILIKSECALVYATNFEAEFKFKIYSN